MSYFDKQGRLDTIAYSGHHTCMELFELKEGFGRLVCDAPMDATEYIPAGGSYLCEPEGMAPWPASVLCCR